MRFGIGRLPPLFSCRNPLLYLASIPGHAAARPHRDSSNLLILLALPRGLEPLFSP